MNRRVLILCASCLAAAIVSPWIGPALDGESGELILRELRLPRALVGVLIGAILGIAGAVTQTVLANPLATPSTIGTSAGATLGVLVALVFFEGSQVAGIPLLPAAAFIGALAVTFLVVAVAVRGQARTEDVLIAGIAITLATGALAAGIRFSADQLATFQAMRWSLGSLAQIGYDRLMILVPFAVISVLGMLALTRALEAMAAGEERARTQGVDVVRTRTLALGLSSLGVGAAVALCGPIAFVGLIVPHIVRRLVGSGRRILLPMSALLGAALLPLCDGLARVALPGRELPVGVITAAIGAPLLLLLVARRRR